MNYGFRGGKVPTTGWSTFMDVSTTDTPIWRLVSCITDEELPSEYWINEKKKTVVLKWHDDTITKVKVSKSDKFDARYGFLIAYFQKHCGMSKTKANKYLDDLEKNVD